MNQAEIKTDLENIDGVEVGYTYDEDGHVEVMYVTKSIEHLGCLHLTDGLNAHTMQSLKERCEEHVPEARAEEDEYLRDREQDR